MLELNISPLVGRENRQLPPDAIIMKPVELTPQSDGEPDIGHWGAFCADEGDIKPGDARMNAKAKTFDNRL